MKLLDVSVFSAMLMISALFALLLFNIACVASCRLTSTTEFGVVEWDKGAMVEMLCYEHVNVSMALENFEFDRSA